MSTEIEKKAAGGAISKWDADLAKYAKEAADQEDAGGSFVSTQAGQLSVHGEPVKDNKLKVIVVHSVHENCYYEGKFNPKAKAPPVCYAFGDDEAEMAPHPDSPKPQAAKCSECPMNQWGSSPEGEGKACKNIRRLGLVSADVKPDDMPSTEVVYLKTPVTSSKNWGVYVKTLNAMFSRPPFAVVTEISTTPDKKSQYKVTFKPVGLLGDEYQGPIMEKRDYVVDAIGFPYAKPTAPLGEDGKPKKF